MSEKQKESSEPQADPVEKPQEDYKAMYQTLQSEHQKAVEQLKSAQGTLDTLDQYGAINWDKISGTPQPEEPKENKESPKPDTTLLQALQRQEGRILTLQFRVDNPDLKEYEDDLVAPYVIKARQQNPRKSQDEILKIASDNVRTFLKKHEEQVLARQKEAKIKEDKIKASGLETGAATTPETEVDENQSRMDYVAHRRKMAAKRKGLAV